MTNGDLVAIAGLVLIALAALGWLYTDDMREIK